MAKEHARSHRAACADRSLLQFLELLRSVTHGGPEHFQTTGSDLNAFRGDLPDQSLEVNEFRHAYLWSNIMKKYRSRLSDPSLLRDAALKSMFEAEEHNVSSYLAYKRIPKKVTDLLGHGIFLSASRKISACLGNFNWDECYASSGFGPGSTTNLAKKYGDAYYKFGVLPEVSTNAIPLVVQYLDEYRPLWRDHLLGRYGACYTVRDSNRVTTVPKDSKTDRPIAVEPQWNMYFQKGIGAMIRSRLRRVGVNLNDQSRNQYLAMIGSRDGSLATIDLSSASDTMSRWIVEELIPPDWLAALEQVRSPFGSLDFPGWPSRVLLRKFSSMGNGATFELESLIFWALSTSVLGALGVEDRRVAVYGDDIIVPSTAAEAVCDVLRMAGFIPNPEKTHTTGHFRESCGKHYFRGHDVSPFYIRRPMDDPREWVLLHNNLVKWSMLRYDGCRDAAIKPCVDYLRGLGADWGIPSVPEELGTAGWLSSFDASCPLTIRRYKVNTQTTEYVVKRALVARSQLLHGKQGLQRLMRTLHMSERKPAQGMLEVVDSDFYIPTQALDYGRKTVKVSSWTDLPPYTHFDTGERDEV